MNIFKKGKVTILCDGQFGSTGKGLAVAALLAKNVEKPDICTTNASANAGHTTCWKDGRKIVLFHLPTAGVLCNNSLIYLNAGSIIDAEVLMKEINEHNVRDRLVIHPNAVIIKTHHKEQEQHRLSVATRISSTQKGVGAALSDKVSRLGLLAKDHIGLRPFVARLNLNEKLMLGRSIMMEIPQGYSLSYNSQFYPYTTSRQCTPAQGLADAQISPKFLGKVIMTLRTFPIRVGSLPGHNSGGWYNDQKELSWDDFTVEPETTTVTGRERRIATFSHDQFYEAMTEIQPDIIFLNFMNYMSQEAGMELNVQLIEDYSNIMSKLPHMMYGYGPNVEDVEDVPRG